MRKTILNRIDQLITGRWVDLSIVVFALLAWGATFLQLARGLVHLSATNQTMVFGFGLISLWVIAWFSRGWTVVFFERWLDRTGLRPIAFLLLFGIALRVAWIVLIQAEPSSDGATYIALAHKLLDGADYEIAGTRAYWPPGYPLFLAAFFLVLPSALVVPFSQLILFFVGALGVYRLTKLISNGSAALIALMLFAIWPNLIALSSTPEKEVLVLALLPWVMFWIFRGSVRSGFLAGIGLGASILVQPSLQLMIPALVLLLIVRNGLKSLPSVLLLLLGSLLVIGPWTARNVQVLGVFKLVGTNGGDVLYRANNPLATGGYTSRGEFDLSSLNEIDRDKKGQELALRWIRENPVSFFSLMVEKQVRFMGDDAVGVYQSFRADGANRDSRAYVPLKLFANVWWLILWMLMARLIVQGNRLPVDVRVLVWGWFYLFALHSVFESAGKYHVPMNWVICVVLGALCANSGARLRQTCSK